MFDVIIIGGSYMGLSLSIMLANLGLKVKVIESRHLTFEKLPNEPSRLLAIAQASLDILTANNLSDVFATNTQPIKHIRILEDKSFSYLDFSPTHIGLSQFGVMIEEHVLLSRLHAHCKSHYNIDLMYDVTINSIDTGDLSVVHVEDTQFSAKLVIGCDGKNSWSRRYFGISSQKFDYHQYAIVCDVEHEKNHYGAAIEKFLYQGPFAILPKSGGYSSSIVWTCPSNYANTIAKLDQDLIFECITEYFGSYLGNLKLISEVKLFPITLSHAKSYTGLRFALVGDSAHTIHPLAGQGLNLGIRDAISIADLIKTQKELGLDIGSSMMLSEYERIRRPDNQLMIEATHTLNSLFSNNIYAIKNMRKLGIDILNNYLPLKKLFMKYATGL